MTIVGGSFPNRRLLILLLLLLLQVIFATIIPLVNGTCQPSFEKDNKLYNYSLTNPIRNFPHGILSEDGYSLFLFLLAHLLLCYFGDCVWFRFRATRLITTSNKYLSIEARTDGEKSPNVFLSHFMVLNSPYCWLLLVHLLSFNNSSFFFVSTRVVHVAHFIILVAKFYI